MTRNFGNDRKFLDETSARLGCQGELEQRQTTYTDHDNAKSCTLESVNLISAHPRANAARTGACTSIVVIVSGLNRVVFEGAKQDVASRSLA